MPRKGKHSASMTWADAVARYGEATLTAGVKEKTWKWWRTSGWVPAHRRQTLDTQAPTAAPTKPADLLERLEKEYQTHVQAQVAYLAAATEQRRVNERLTATNESLMAELTAQRLTIEKLTATVAAMTSELEESRLRGGGGGHAARPRRPKKGGRR